MPTLVITRGLPASGKTTWAKEWLAEAPHTRARLNRDDLRATVFGAQGVLPYALEEQVTALQRSGVRSLLAAGFDVVVDDLNLRARFARAWADLAKALGVEFAVRDFLDVPVDECVRRDAERGLAGGRAVGEEAIRAVHARFLAAGRLPAVTTSADREAPPARTYTPDAALPPAWLVDVDGTLALRGDHAGVRSFFDWARVGEDATNPPVVDLVRALSSMPQPAAIVVMSGRDAVCRPETEDWLTRHGIPFDALFMRAAGDTRPDDVVKAELFWQHVAPSWQVRGVLDDRDKVVAMWRALGLTCAQVAPGDF